MRKKLFSEEKLDVAKFFFDKLCEARADKEFTYYLDGFLTAAVSVLDVLLEDGNVIFSLDIPLEEKLYPEVFEKKAKELGKEEALEFIKWFKRVKKGLKKDRICKLILDKRRITVHRRLVKPEHIEVTITESISLRVECEVEVRNKTGKIIVKKTIKSPSKIKEKGEKVHIEYFFKTDYGETPVMEACEKFLRVLENVVQEAKNRFFKSECF